MEKGQRGGVAMMKEHKNLQQVKEYENKNKNNKNVSDSDSD